MPVQSDERADELTALTQALHAEISERQQVEKALRESETRYRNLVHEVRDGLFMVDARGVITFASRSLVRIHGVDDPEQLVGRSLLELFVPIERNRIQEVFDRAVETGATTEVVETKIVRPDGEGIFIEVKASPILEQGVVRGFQGTLRDVTERKQAEERIHLQMMALEAAANGIIITNRNGIILWANPAFAVLTGYSL